MHWNSELYDDKHDYVAHYGLRLVTLLDPKLQERILDLGCGTGFLTHAIHTHGAIVVGMDASSSMIEKAKEQYPSLLFQVGRGEDFHFDTLFDAVFSNAALHWMTPPSKVIACVWKSLQRKGRFVFEFGGKDNVKQILDAIQQAANVFALGPVPLENFYPSIGEYASLLEKQGFDVIQMQRYQRPTCLQGKEGIRNWVTMFRPEVLARIPEEKKNLFLAEVEKYIPEALYHDESYWADYVRICGIAIKPE